MLEKCVREVVESSQLSEIRTQSTLVSISEDENWVYATYINRQGETKKVKCRFLAAADGKTGFTRKNYLEPKGVRLEWAEKYE